MTTRTANVTIEVVEHMTGAYEIDEQDYLQWLDGTDDTDEAMREYLVSGDDGEVIQSVYDAATRRGSREVWSSEIERVTR